jgi:Condensation domain
MTMEAMTMSGAETATGGGRRWPASASQRWVVQAARAATAGEPGLLMSIVVRLRGPVDLDLLDRAYDELVARHQVLRTRLVRDGGAVWQEVDDHQPVALRRFPTPVSDGDEASLVEEWTSWPVPFGEPPAVRGFLAERGSDNHLVGLTFDHTAVDPRSLTNAVRDLAAVYSARVAGEPPPPPPLQYGEYAAWQQERLAARLRTDRQAWRAALKGVRPPRYRRDHEFVAGQLPAGRELWAALLDAEELEAVDAWSWRQRSTTFCSLLAAFARTCTSWTEARDLPIATVFEQRDHPAARDAIGPYVHGSLLRITVEDGEPWAAVVPRLREVVTAAYARAHVPLVEVVLRTPRLVAGTRGWEPSWCRSFQYIPSDPLTTLDFGPATGELVRTRGPRPSTVDYGVHLRVERAVDGGLVGRLAYDANELTPASATSFLGEWVTTVREMIGR